MEIQSLRHTPLYESHLAAGARMVAFAGYQMPVQYPLGVLKEHLWTRHSAGLFDESHMGQAWISGVAPGAALEEVIPASLIGLGTGRQRYCLLLNRQGGIVDDLMLARPAADRWFMVVNGACQDKDFAFLEEELARQVRIERLQDQALLALQGPRACEVLAQHVPQVRAMAFMDSHILAGFGHELVISRSGYTGEDGFEISLPASAAPEVWASLCGDERVQPIGLGARDSLRLEAGLPLYGQDLDESVSPSEAGLSFAVARSRREAGDFPGAARIRRELAEGPARLRVGLKGLGGAPAREGAPIVDDRGGRIGTLTSSGFSPSLGHPVALGFVPPSLSRPGTRLGVIVRGKTQPVEIVPLPFVPHAYVRQPQG